MYVFYCGTISRQSFALGVLIMKIFVLVSLLCVSVAPNTIQPLVLRTEKLHRND